MKKKKKKAKQAAKKEKLEIGPSLLAQPSTSSTKEDGNRYYLLYFAIPLYEIFFAVFISYTLHCKINVLYMVILYHLA